eukprot:GDKH01001188.1.p3 GENE.GDKH01001188.1~~GDKH01001188.1.p3  ORF type:complete len:64 (-),score=0.48 GDKH01001188.1:89-280(-)
MSVEAAVEIGWGRWRVCQFGNPASTLRHPASTLRAVRVVSAVPLSASVPTRNCGHLCFLYLVL